MPPVARKPRVVGLDSEKKKTLHAPITPEAEENQMISLAVDLAKRQLLDGSASSQLITHYLQLGSSKKRQEAEIMELQKELLKAKTEAIKSAKTSEELYTKAIKAMGIYSGAQEPEDEEDETY